ncbi:YkgJ family cysteine cluster protein [Halalkalibacillus halophilus]|uniref:YkgJ family cysteine cluster protein n=1 Tax=Halalkalibacillus halophilus TaxID=392827 RepID=UPI00041DFE26|nr:YkgJ family cysteine cluster protein [Halalkalibacillus halophilus]
MTHRTVDEVKARLDRLQSFDFKEERFTEIAENQLNNNELSDRQVLLYSYHNLLGEVSHKMDLMDEHMDMKPTCFMGCAFCCYFPIITTRLEAKMITYAIENMEPERQDYIKRHLENYFEKYHEKIEHNTSLDFEAGDIKHEYMQKQLPCPLLDEKTNTCLAYEWRPLPCRTYVNYMDPKICEENLVPEETVSFEFLYEDYMGTFNEVAQVIAQDNDQVLDYPTDLFQYDYLPVFLREWMNK